MKSSTSILVGGALFTLFLLLGGPGELGAQAQGVQGMTMETTPLSSPIRDLIEHSYIDVVYGSGPIARLREALHPGFHIYAIVSDDVLVRDVDTWLSRLETNKNRRSGPQPEYAHQFMSIEVTGDLGVATFRVFRDGQLRYTDVLSLYRVTGEWRIMTKLFAQH